MSGIVKSPLQTAVVEGIYNDILTRNAQYYYFLGKTSLWSTADGATTGIDGVVVPSLNALGQPILDINGSPTTHIEAPQPADTFRYELATRNNIIIYKLLKSSDVSYVIPRHNWVANTVWDMYDDSYSITTPAHSGATTIEAAKYYVLTSLNNVYKCISNNYDAISTIEPSGTGVDEFTTADGYIWQFMYNIPVALQNKFYTAEYIPVMTALRNRFYENGAIGNVAVIQPGSGYTGTYTSLAVAGDGYLENNPYAVGENCVVIDGGVGYKSSKSVSTASWVGGVATFSSATHGFVNGENITIRGVTPSAYNGDYVVANAAAGTFDVTIVADPGAYSAGGTISKKILTFSAPLWGAFKTQITGYTTVSAGIITTVKCDLKTADSQSVYGYGYDSTGTVTIEPPVVHDFVWAANTAYVVTKILKANNNFYQVVPIVFATQSLTWATGTATVTTTTAHGLASGASVIIAGTTAPNPTPGYNGTFTITVTGTTTFTYALATDPGGAASVQGTVSTTAGTTNATLPVHTTGTIQFGTCALTFIATQASATLTLTKTEAKLTPIVINGQITGVTIVNAGVGYTYCNVIPVDTPTNTTAQLIVDLAVGNLDTMQADVELEAYNTRRGALSYIKMEYDPITGYKTGSGYTTTDTTVTITGDGTGATAKPIIQNGSIVAIELTNHGTGYQREATVTITPAHIVSAVDVGAKARAILGPSGGHGSNATREFNSNSILFYSVLSDERIHGIPNLNDYRQFGVIKNPVRYGDVSRITATSATASWVVTASADISTLNFNKDDELQQGGSERFQIIDISGAKMILQAFSQVAPTASTFVNTTVPRNGNSFTAISVTTPEVDKFSGELLFIDNKLPFVVTQDQMIAFRTLLSF